MTTTAAEPKTKTDKKPDADKGPERGGALRFLRELTGLLITALVLVLIIKTFFFQAFFIPSASMEGTLMVGDRVLVEKLPYDFHDPRRGDIIVFSDPHPPAGESRGLIGGLIHWIGKGIGVQRPENPDYIKRVIGLPGETVLGNRRPCLCRRTKLERALPHRANGRFPETHRPARGPVRHGRQPRDSLDSRFTPTEGGLGYAPIDKVIGKAFVIVWPTNRWNTLGSG